MGIKTWKHKVRPLLQFENCLGVQLSDGSVALVDFEDRHIVEPWNWTASKSRNGPYAMRGDGKITIQMHAAIAGPRSDHINRNPLDNRRSNLRHASSAENARNRSRSSINTSGYKGVTFRKDRGTWLAIITCNGKVIKIGTFHSAELAAAAYDAKARELFGQFACTNFSPPPPSPEYDAMWSKPFYPANTAEVD